MGPAIACLSTHLLGILSFEERLFLQFRFVIQAFLLICIHPVLVNMTVQLITAQLLSHTYRAFSQCVSRAMIRSGLAMSALRKIQPGLQGA